LNTHKTSYASIYHIITTLENNTSTRHCELVIYKISYIHFISNGVIYTHSKNTNHSNKNQVFIFNSPFSLFLFM